MSIELSTVQTVAAVAVYWLCVNLAFYLLDYYKSLEFKRIFYDGAYKRGRLQSTVLFLLWPFILPVMFILLVLIAINTGREL